MRPKADLLTHRRAPPRGPVGFVRIGFVGGLESFHLDGGHFNVWSDQDLNAQLGDILNQGLKGSLGG